MKNDKRFDGKVNLAMVPSYCLEILANPLTIGIEKGYTPNSWLAPGTPRSFWLGALKRHMAEYEKGIGWYTELDKNGKACPTKANHAYAMAFNSMAIALSVYRGMDDENDLPETFRVK